jgi:glycosyltransferase involved in cell wall biosynthesis
MTSPAGTGEAQPPSVLYIADRMLTPEIDGASARKLEILRSLRRLGCRVTFAGHHPHSFFPFDRTLAEDTRRLEDLGFEVAGPPAVDSPLRYVAEHGREHALVVMSPYPIAHGYLRAVRAHAPEAVAVYNAIDLGHVQHYRRARVSGKVPDLKRAIEAKALEIWLAEHADATLVCSDEERETLLSLCPRADVRVVSHVAALRAGTPAFDRRSGLLFLGSFLHLANVDAMQTFVGGTLPLIRRSLPGVTLAMVGADPRGDVRPLAGPGVVAAGWVPDLATYFDATRVFVAPLRYGAGIKIKVLDSLAAGVPVVVTPVAAEGLHLTDGVDALVAESAEEFARAVVRLHGDAGLWQRLADGGRDLLRRRFSNASMDEALRGLLELAARGRRAVAAAD